MDAKNIKISVIIPVYNRESTIVSCIESVLDQSYPADEIIVVDDSSTDGTIEQLEIFKEKLIILKTKSKSGAQVARNIGIKAANSNWIAFLDSDDVWLFNKLEKQVLALKESKYDLNTVIHCNCFIKTKDKKSNKYWELPILEGDSVLAKTLSHSTMLFPGLLTSKKCLVNINYLDENVMAYQEWDTAIRLAHHCKFIHVQEPLFIYNQNHGETISDNLKRSFIGYQYIITKHKQDILKYCGDEINNKHLITSAILAMNAGDFNNGGKVLHGINQFSKKIIVLKLCAFFHIKPKYPISIGSYIKGKL